MMCEDCTHQDICKYKEICIKAEKDISVIDSNIKADGVIVVTTICRKHSVRPNKGDGFHPGGR